MMTKPKWPILARVWANKSLGWDSGGNQTRRMAMSNNMKNPGDVGYYNKRAVGQKRDWIHAFAIPRFLQVQVPLTRRR
jgi:hypothetical protein